ncbi:hypothetical protein A7982_13634 [Minicystis rosea]|nr:hypothetical protein A7982_13634 [Minicystis rosea]
MNMRNTLALLASIPMTLGLLAGCLVDAAPLEGADEPLGVAEERATASDAGSTCPHSEYTTGAKLQSGCDACVTTVCKSDSYCCSTKWDSTCVSEAKAWCGASSSSSSSSSSSGGSSTCSHSECATGTKLKTGCDACVTTVCKSDTYCCSTSWDSTCVSEAKSWCALSCP